MYKLGMYSDLTMHTDPDFVRLGAHNFERRIRRIFEQRELQAIARGQPFTRTPFTNMLYEVWNEESIAKLKRVECCALAARKWWRTYRHTLPSWAWTTALPISDAKCEELTSDQNLRLNFVGYYGGSLKRADWDYERHPSVLDCCSGLMAHEDCPDYIRADRELLQEFRPKPLVGLSVRCVTGYLDGRPFKVLDDLYWSTPEMICAELQSLIYIRQCYCDHGVAEEYLQEWDEHIARVSRVYPDKFAT
jgi:hypothetical protein